MIIFDEESHSYWEQDEQLNEVYVPSVSELLRPVAPDFSMVNPAVLDKARRRGEAVHAITEGLDMCGGDPKDVDIYVEQDIYEDVYRMVDSWLKFKKETKVRISAIEEIVYNKELGYAGRLDRLTDDGVLDIKCTSRISKGVGLQLTAYDMAVSRPNEWITAVRLTTKGYEVHRSKPSKEAIAIIEGLARLYHWKNILKKEKK